MATTATIDNYPAHLLCPANLRNCGDRRLDASGSDLRVFYLVRLLNKQAAPCSVKGCGLPCAGSSKLARTTRGCNHNGGMDLGNGQTTSCDPLRDEPQLASLDMPVGPSGLPTATASMTARADHGNAKKQEGLSIRFDFKLGHNRLGHFDDLKGLAAEAAIHAGIRECGHYLSRSPA
jgi:hypothetical protein